MQVLLATSPYVNPLPETGMLRRGIIGDVLVRHARRPRVYSQYERAGLRPAGAKVDRRLLIDTYMRGASLPSMSDTQDPARILLDKDPRLVEWLPVLRHLFDDAKIVLVVRDPRAVAASKQRARWSANRTLFRTQLEAEIQASLALEFLAREEREHVFLVSFTELVTCPLDTINSVLVWLGSPRVQAIDTTERARVASGLVSEEEMQWKGRVFEPVEPERMHAWIRHLSPSEKEMVDGLATAQFELCRLAQEQLALDVEGPKGPAFAVFHGAHHAGVGIFTALRRHQHRRAVRHLDAGWLGRPHCDE